MAKKIGRNDLCLCGSGKKYKNCCIEDVVHYFRTSNEDWHKIRRIEGELINDHLAPYLETIPSHIMGEALGVLFEDDFPEEMDRKCVFDQFFIPWFLFGWVSFSQERSFPYYDFDLTPSENYAKYYGNRLSRAEKEYIEVANKARHRFYQVEKVVRYESLEIVDIFLGTKYVVHEIRGTEQLRPGDIIFSSVITIDGHSVLLGMFPMAFPPKEYCRIIDWKKKFKLIYGRKAKSLLQLHELQIGLLVLCTSLLIDLYAPVRLQNTDGDPIQLSRAHFRLHMGIEEAIEKMVPLALIQNLDELLSDAERDEHGVIQKIIFSWSKLGNKVNKHWDNTTLGTITILKSKLILETNSKKRITRGRKLIEKYLGEKVVWEKTVFEDPLIIPRSSHQSFEERKETNLDVIDEVEQTEEMRQYLKQTIAKHWESWFDNHIPVLGGKTPREAAKTAEGRKLLQALLYDFEQQNERKSSDDPLRVDIAFLKKELAL